MKHAWVEVMQLQLEANNTETFPMTCSKVFIIGYICINIYIRPLCKDFRRYMTNGAPCGKILHQGCDSCKPSSALLGAIHVKK